MKIPCYSKVGMITLLMMVSNCASTKAHDTKLTQKPDEEKAAKIEANPNISCNYDYRFNSENNKPSKQMRYYYSDTGFLLKLESFDLDLPDGDQLQNTIYYQYNIKGKVEKITKTLTQVNTEDNPQKSIYMSFVYDDQERLNDFKFTYDPPKEAPEPSEDSVHYQYDNEDLIEILVNSGKDGKNLQRRIGFIYDQSHHLIEKNIYDMTYSEQHIQIKYTYGNIGGKIKLIKAIKGSDTLTYSYDSSGYLSKTELVAEDWNNKKKTTKKEYDHQGRVTSIEEYDENSQKKNRIDTIYDEYGNETEVTKTYFSIEEGKEKKDVRTTINKYTNGYWVGAGDDSSVATFAKITCKNISTDDISLSIPIKRKLQFDDKNLTAFVRYVLELPLSFYPNVPYDPSWKVGKDQPHSKDLLWRKVFEKDEMF